MGGRGQIEICRIILYNPMFGFATNYFSCGVEGNPQNFVACKSGTSGSTDAASDINHYESDNTQDFTVFKQNRGRTQ